MRKLVKAILVIAGTSISATAMAADGAKLYNQLCGACHGEDGAGKPKMAPALKGNKFLKSSDEATLIKLIKTGRMGAAKKYSDIPVPMPPQAQLKDDQIKAVIAYAKKSFAK